MTDWKHFNSSQYAAKCCYCNRDIHTSEGRWNAVKDSATGKGRWNACHNCIPPPEKGKDASPPAKPDGVPNAPPSLPVSPSGGTPEPTEEKPVVPSSTQTYTPENSWAKAHDDNMLSYELTRICMTKLTEELHIIAEQISHVVTQQTKRNELLEKKGG